MFQCSICLSEQPTLPVVTQCGHVYCYSCISRWMDVQNNSGCPQCKQSLDSHFVFAIAGGQSGESSPGSQITRRLQTFSYQDTCRNTVVLGTVPIPCPYQLANREATRLDVYVSMACNNDTCTWEMAHVCTQYAMALCTSSSLYALQESLKTVNMLFRQSIANPSDALTAGETLNCLGGIFQDICQRLNIAATPVSDLETDLFARLLELYTPLPQKEQTLRRVCEQFLYVFRDALCDTPSIDTVPMRCVQIMLALYDRYLLPTGNSNSAVSLTIQQLMSAVALLAARHNAPPHCETTVEAAVRSAHALETLRKKQKKDNVERVALLSSSIALLADSPALIAACFRAATDLFRAEPKYWHYAIEYCRSMLQQFPRKTAAVSKCLAEAMSSKTMQQSPQWPAFANELSCIALHPRLEMTHAAENAFITNVFLRPIHSIMAETDWITIALENDGSHSRVIAAIEIYHRLCAAKKTSALSAHAKANNMIGFFHEIMLTCSEQIMKTARNPAIATSLSGARPKHFFNQWLFLERSIDCYRSLYKDIMPSPVTLPVSVRDNVMVHICTYAMATHRRPFLYWHHLAARCLCKLADFRTLDIVNASRQNTNAMLLHCFGRDNYTVAISILNFCPQQFTELFEEVTPDTVLRIVKQCCNRITLETTSVNNSAKFMSLLIARVPRARRILLSSSDALEVLKKAVSLVLVAAHSSITTVSARADMLAEAIIGLFHSPECAQDERVQLMILQLTLSVSNRVWRNAFRDRMKLTVQNHATLLISARLVFAAAYTPTGILRRLSGEDMNRLYQALLCYGALKNASRSLLEYAPRFLRLLAEIVHTAPSHHVALSVVRSKTFRAAFNHAAWLTTSAPETETERSAAAWEILAALVNQAISVDSEQEILNTIVCCLLPAKHNTAHSLVTFAQKCKRTEDAECVFAVLGGLIKLPAFDEQMFNPKSRCRSAAQVLEAIDRTTVAMAEKNHLKRRHPRATNCLKQYILERSGE